MATAIDRTTRTARGRLGACALVCLASLAGTAAQAQASSTFGPVYQTLSDPCAVFNAPVPGTTFTKVVYGEPIAFTIRGETVTIVDTSTSPASLKFLVNAHGDGVGAVSGIAYRFQGKLQTKVRASGSVTDPGFRYDGSLKLSARVIGQGNEASTGRLAQGAQDNAVFDFRVQVQYAAGQTMSFFDSVNSSTTLSCQASPWANQMSAPREGSKTAVGRGFGDVWNKYAWSMQDFAGGLVVGTKNAWYDAARLATYYDEPPGSTAAQCTQDPGNPIPPVFRPLVCAELFESPPQTAPSRPATDTRFAEIWRLDYAKKSWRRVRDDTASQGFRVMAPHAGQLYVGSDLGSFVAGVDLKSGGAGAWNFPGVRLLRSADGTTYTEVPCGPAVSGPCNAATGSPTMMPDVNISIRALASWGDKLYVGTFNPMGGELWSYSATAGWARLKKFAPDAQTQYHAAVTELAVFNNRLYLGLGASSSDYLHVYDGTQVSPVPNLPLPGSPSGAGVLKLFPSTKGVLLVGTVDFARGFGLYTLDALGNFGIVTSSGFGDPAAPLNLNAYPWSIAEIGGRTFVGTFNTGIFNKLPRGSAELWQSDDLASWQQVALPLDFGYWNYGIRTMTTANKQLYLGTASTIVAPDGVSGPLTLTPGLEVWSIRSNAASPGGR